MNSPLNCSAVPALGSNLDVCPRPLFPTYLDGWLDGQKFNSNDRKLQVEFWFLYEAPPFHVLSPSLLFKKSKLNMMIKKVKAICPVLFPVASTSAAIVRGLLTICDICLCECVEYRNEFLQMAYYASIKNCFADTGTFHGDFVCSELRMYFLLRPVTSSAV